MATSETVTTEHDATAAMDYAATSTGDHEVSHEITLYAEQVGHIGSFPITNALLTSWVVVGIILILSLVIRFSVKKVPGKLQSVFELLLDAAYDLCDQVTGSRKITTKVSTRLKKADTTCGTSIPWMPICFENKKLFCRLMQKDWLKIYCR